MSAHQVVRIPGTVIIGAGISGLTAAYTLYQAGHPVLLLEAGSRPGGLIHTIRDEGFVMEAGPNTFPSTAKEILALGEELGLKPKATHQQAQKRYLYLNGHLTALPSKPWQAITTPALSLAGKLRVLQEPLQPRTKTQDISVADFVEKRLGKEVLNHLVDPFISGIYAGNVAELSLPAVFPKLWEWEQAGGSLFKGAQLARKKAQQAGQPRRKKMELLSFPKGLGELTDALAKAIPHERLLFERSVTQLEPLPNVGYRIHTHTGEVFECRNVILATPAYTASHLLQTLNPIVSQELAGIPYNSLMVLHLGFPKSAIPHALDGFGCLVPRQEKLPLLGAIWASSLFPSRVPEGQVLLSCFVGGAHHPELFDWPPEDVQRLVLDNLQTIFKTHRPLEPTYSHTLSYERAIPQYTLGHRERIEALERDLQEHHPGILLCGNYLHGIALNECVKSAQTAAEQILS